MNKTFWKKWLPAIAVVALLGLSWGGYRWWQNNTGWHEFEATDEQSPQAYVEYDPDYAYRLGDVVPIVIHVKQQPGTKVDVEALSFKGDFELCGAATVKTRELADGSVCYRVDLRVQSLKALLKRSLAGEVTWCLDADNEIQQLALPEIVIYGSNTWDGRQQFQQGHPQPLPIWLMITKSMVALVGSIALLTWLAVKSYVIWRRNKYLVSSQELLLAHINGIWKRIEEGDASPAHYAEIERLVRLRWQVENISSKELSKKLNFFSEVIEALREFLDLSALAIYSDEKLDADHNELLKSLSIKVINLSFAEEERAARRAAELAEEAAALEENM